MGTSLRSGAPGLGAEKEAEWPPAANLGFHLGSIALYADEAMASFAFPLCEATRRVRL